MQLIERFNSQESIHCDNGASKELAILEDVQTDTPQLPDTNPDLQLSDDLALNDIVQAETLPRSNQRNVLVQTEKVVHSIAHMIFFVCGILWKNMKLNNYYDSRKTNNQKSNYYNTITRRAFINLQANCGLEMIIYN